VHERLPTGTFVHCLVPPPDGFVARAAISLTVIVAIALARCKLIVGSQLSRSRTIWIPVAVGFQSINTVPIQTICRRR